MFAENVVVWMFWLMAAASVGFALAVVTSSRILRAAVYLAGALVGAAGLYILLGMEFLAGVQVLVYVGGIVVLIVFAVMLTGSVELQEKPATLVRKLFGLFGAGSFFFITVYAFRMTIFNLDIHGARPDSDVKAIGHQLLDYGSDGYVLPFEIISLLLLASLIGGIVVARKGENEGRAKS